MLPSVTRVFTLQQPLQLLNIIYTNRICQATTTDVCSESSCLSTDNTVCLGQQNKSCRVNNKYTSGLIRNRRWGIWRFPQTPCRGEGNKKMPWPKQGWVWHTHRSQGDHRSCLQITYRAWIIQAEAAGSMRTDRWELAAAALAGFILSIQARKSRAPAKKSSAKLCQCRGFTDNLVIHGILQISSWWWMPSLFLLEVFLWSSGWRSTAKHILLKKKAFSTNLHSTA